MNVNEVTYSEDLKSDIKEDADGKWFSLSFIVLLIVVIVDNYNELILTPSRQIIHWIVDKQEWYTNNFTLPQNGARCFSVYGVLAFTWSKMAISWNITCCRELYTTAAWKLLIAKCVISLSLTNPQDWDSFQNKEM